MLCNLNYAQGPTVRVCHNQGLTGHGLSRSRVDWSRFVKVKGGLVQGWSRFVKVKGCLVTVGQGQGLTSHGCQGKELTGHGLSRQRVDWSRFVKAKG